MIADSTVTLDTPPAGGSGQLPADATATTGPSRTAALKAIVERCKNARKELVPEWATNVDMRRGKPFQEDSDQDRVQVTYDWSATKAKQAQLFSQVPEVRLTHKNDKYRAVAPMFAKKVNDELGEARVGVAMDEILPDCINAAGIGALMLAFETRTEKRSIPTVPPAIAAQIQAAGGEVPTSVVDTVIDSRYTISRISPADLLWDVSFSGSDFDDSPLLGHSGRKPWADALNAFGKSDTRPNGLTEADKSRVVGGDTRSTSEMLAGDGSNTNSLKNVESNIVSYDEVFYWRYLRHPEETNFRAIQRVVFVKGKAEPVIDEPWTGQKKVGDKLFGARKYPIRILTLTYLSDESIPPSDSAMGRPQVNELNRSRSQMVRNREASTPLRWFNVNLVDVAVQAQMMRGTWQGMIPMNGDGSRAMGEVARAAYPNEDYNFDNIAKSDLRETWQVEDAIDGGPAIRSATEASNRQQNFATRIGYERARCARLLVGTAEVLGGLISLFGTFTPEEQQQLQQAGIQKEMLSDCYAFNVRADSTLLLTADQRIERLMKYLNMVAKSGYVDVAPVIAEVTELVGLDPSVVIHNPQGKGPEPINASLRLTGAADLSDPFVVAMLIHAQQWPTADEINQAKLSLAALAEQPTPPAPQGGPDGGQPGAPPAGGPPAGGPPQATSGAPPASPNAAAAGGSAMRPVSGGRPHVPYTSHPDWNTASRIERRSEDGK